MQEEVLLSFAESDETYQKYYDEITLLLCTVLRISQFCGLTTKDLDFQNRIINVDHQLLKGTGIGYYIEKPKAIIVDGYSDFIFLNKNGLPKVASSYNNMFKALIKKYNKNHKDTLPNVTPHTFRHYHANLLIQMGFSPLLIADRLGNEKVQTPMDTYSHLYPTKQIEVANKLDLLMGTEPNSQNVAIL